MCRSHANGKSCETSASASEDKKNSTPVDPMEPPKSDKFRKGENMGDKKTKETRSTRVDSGST